MLSAGHGAARVTNTCNFVTYGHRQNRVGCHHRSCRCQGRGHHHCGLGVAVVIIVGVGVVGVVIIHLWHHRQHTLPCHNCDSMTIISVSKFRDGGTTNHSSESQGIPQIVLRRRSVTEMAQHHTPLATYLITHVNLSTKPFANESPNQVST